MRAKLRLVRTDAASAGTEQRCRLAWFPRAPVSDDQPVREGFALSMAAADPRQLGKRASSSTAAAALSPPALAAAPAHKTGATSPGG